MLASALAGQRVPAPTTAAAGVPEVLLREGFEEGLSGWQQAGQAEFAADAKERHDGKLSVRITVPPGADASRAMLWREIAGTAQGDWMKVGAWCRSQDVADGDGPFALLEFVDASGKRLDIVHPVEQRNRGKAAWEYAEIDGVVPLGTAQVRVGVMLRSHGTAWFDDLRVLRTFRHADLPSLGDSTRLVVVHADRVLNARFGGVGFHIFDHACPATQEQLDEVLNKRWRELNPSFARINLSYLWDRAQLEEVALRLRRLRDTDTEIYATTWDPPQANTPAELAAYARHVVDVLQFFVREKGYTNLRYYCMSNELTLTRWGSLHADLPRFKQYHQAVYDELRARKLDIGLLATDGSPISYWDSIEWAANNMDDITAVYGGHHYFDDYDPADVQFYPWFLKQNTWAADLARSKGKDFILGEFGGKLELNIKLPDGRVAGKYFYYETPREPTAALQLPEAALAAINGGAHAMGFWTFSDCSWGEDHTRLSWTGLFHFDGTDCAARAPYYAYGLLTKFFRGPSTVYQVSGSDPLLRVAAVQHTRARTWSIAVLNRNARAVNLDLSMEGAAPTASFRKYVYDSNCVPSNPFGDLQGPRGKVAMKDGRLSDSVGPLTLTVYTTAYDDDPPAAVAGLKVEPAGKRGSRLSWQPSPERDLCYYRVFRSEKADFVPDTVTQIASTIATHFTDTQAATGKEYHYKVVAVDTSGNPAP